MDDEIKDLMEEYGLEKTRPRRFKIL